MLFIAGRCKGGHKWVRQAVIAFASRAYGRSLSISGDDNKPTL